MPVRGHCIVVVAVDAIVRIGLGLGGCGGDEHWKEIVQTRATLELGAVGGLNGRLVQAHGMWRWRWRWRNWCARRQRCGKLGQCTSRFRFRSRRRLGRCLRDRSPGWFWGKQQFTNHTMAPTTCEDDDKTTTTLLNHRFHTHTRSCLIHTYGWSMSNDIMHRRDDEYGHSSQPDFAKITSDSTSLPHCSHTLLATTQALDQQQPLDQPQPWS